MNFGSVCSGIEAASLAWLPLGWKAAWLAEIEPFPCSVLAHHYPGVPNLGDMTAIAAKVRSGAVAAPAVLVGGTPCQAFSIAGLRNSLEDERGQLSLEYVRLLDAIDSARYVRGEPAAIAIWENVPGVLNTKDNAFGCFLAGLAGEDAALVPSGGRWTNAGCVYGPKRTIAWRIFDAQYFGVAQRRRRVFVVASARNGFNPAAVLFEFYSLRRDIAPSREAREEIAGKATGRANGGGIAFGGNNQGGAIDVATARNACASASGRMDFETETFIVQDVAGTLNANGKAAGSATQQDAESGMLIAQLIAFDSRQDCVSSTEVFGALGSSSPQAQAVAFNDVAATLKGGSGARGYPDPSDGNGHSLVGTSMAVRRLTPVECEALQGFPRNYTLVPHRGKPAADGPRYKSLGNSMAVPVMAWIGKRIAMVCEVTP